VLFILYTSACVSRERFSRTCTSAHQYAVLTSYADYAGDVIFTAVCVCVKLWIWNNVTWLMWFDSLLHFVLWRGWPLLPHNCLLYCTVSVFGIWREQEFGEQTNKAATVDCLCQSVVFSARQHSMFVWYSHTMNFWCNAVVCYFSAPLLWHYFVRWPVMSRSSLQGVFVLLHRRWESNVFLLLMIDFGDWLFLVK